MNSRRSPDAGSARRTRAAIARRVTGLSPGRVAVRSRAERKPQKEEVVQYAFLIYEAPGSYDGLTDDDRKALTAEYMALREDERVVGGGRLQGVETATTLRVQDGQTLVADGPFAETKEVFGGYYLFESDNLDAAIELAGRIPALRMNGSVEVRPLWSYDTD